MIHVMIADDQQLLIDLLTIGLEQSGEIKVVASAKNGFEAIKQAKQVQPDVILMDILMPGCDGIEATRLIKEWNNATRILILTNGIQESNLPKAIQAGADGYVLKNISQPDLVLAVQSVYANMKIIGNEAEQLSEPGFFLDNHLNITEKKIMINDEAVVLSGRELDLITMIVAGKEVSEMAAVLNLSEGSVRNLTSGLINKLKVKDRTQLAVFALKNHLVEA